MPSMDPTDDRRSPDVSPGLAGWLAGGVGLLTLLVGAAASGGNGLLELVANGATAFVPVPVFDAILGALGPLAKGLLFALVALVVPLAGALLALGLERVGQLRSASGWSAAVRIGLVAWLLAEVVVLPLFGQGLFGSNHRGDPLALHLPIAAAALAYGLVLLGLVRRTPESTPATRSAVPASAVDASRGSTGDGLPTAAGPGPTPAAGPVDDGLDRRSFMRRALVALGGFSLVASGVVVASRIATAVSKPLGPGTAGSALVDAFGVTPAITPLDDFYVIGKDLLPTEVDGATWRLAITGLVGGPVDWTADDLAGLPRVEGHRTLQCISNEVVRFGSLIGNQWWAGVRMRDVLDAVGVRPEARWVLFRSADGYTESIPLEVARDDETWLVSEMVAPGTPLPREHGFPLRALIADRYGMKQPKYLTGVALAAEDEPGYWEQRGWDETAAIRTYSRIDAPVEGEDVPVGMAFGVYGIASGGDRGVARVEVSLDDGKTWADAELEPLGAGISEITWRRWRASMIVPAAGRAVLVARATDGAGGVQEAEIRPPLPSGATGLHRVAVNAIG